MTFGTAWKVICIIAAILLFLLWAFNAGPAWAEAGGFVALAASFLPIP